MIYNTQREKMILPEYGRTIQEMVDICLQIEDRSERQICAETIIEIMRAMNPNVRQQPDYEHKLWDQLAILSDYKLDIDYPYEVIQREEMNAKPKPLKYPMQRIRYRHYGHLTEAFMKELKEMPDSPERTRLTEMIANYMKRSLYNWNRDAMDERKVAADIDNYTEGNVNLPEGMRFASVSNGHLPGSNASKKKRRK
ncbi:MAG: DUF4290 domain-containing protein [Bacteroidaceae bacterium]|nr:DUF4290 domain-containing protein [Bacteroidaceae bacterium]